MALGLGFQGSGFGVFFHVVGLSVHARGLGFPGAGSGHSKLGWGLLGCETLNLHSNPQIDDNHNQINHCLQEE